MGEGKVTQDDRDAAANAWARRFGKSHFEDEIMDLFEGRNDQHPLVQDFARHRQAAEKAQQERDAAYIEGKGGVIPGAVVFASLVSGNSMPCMSGDPRDRMTAYRRRQFDDATHALATAIRSQGHE